MEIKFEESLWYQFALTGKDRLPNDLMLEILKVFFIRTPDQILSNKIQELTMIIEAYSKQTYRERESKQSLYLIQSF